MKLFLRSSDRCLLQHGSTSYDLLGEFMPRVFMKLLLVQLRALPPAIWQHRSYDLLGEFMPLLSIKLFLRSSERCLLQWGITTFVAFLGTVKFRSCLDSL